MCGIAGVINFGPDKILPEDRRHDFIQPLKFRGPDDKGEWHHSNEVVDISLFHTRLSIIDLSPTGHQPMNSEEAGVCVVFNGEIYNYQKLKEELKNTGAAFKTSSDTEVLIHGFRQWGFANLLAKIDGMFSIVLVDIKRNEIWIARDRFGKKPLYYALLRNSLIVSSDIRSFYSIPQLAFTLDMRSLGYFFYEQSTPGNDSIWQEIKKVPAAHFGFFSKDGLHFQKYWTLTFSSENKLSWHDTIDKTYELLKKAVAKRLVADVPVAAQLSGGIDSSLVVAMMAELTSEPVRTYTVSFDEEELDESRYARQVADIFGTKHTELKLSQMELATMDSLIGEFGEPFSDVSMLPTYLICKEISKTEKVVCGGDGGDELFAGYYINYFVDKVEKVRPFRSLAFLASLAARLTSGYRINLLRDALEAANQPQHMLLDRRMGFDKTELRKLGLNEMAVNSMEGENQRIWQQFHFPHLNLSKNLTSCFLHTRLENDYLVKVDRASMYASLEMRSPFLDKDLAAFAATLTKEDLLGRHGTKSVLKQLAERFFPKNFVHRHKMGFGAPISTWLRGKFHNHFKEVVIEQRQSMVDIKYGFIEQLLNEHAAGKDHTQKLWSLYVFHVWIKTLSKRR